MSKILDFNPYLKKDNYENDEIYNTWLDDSCIIFVRMFLMRKKLHEALSK